MINTSQLSFKDRISLYFIMYSAILLLFVFFIIYFIVNHAVNHHINQEITTELEKHYQEIEMKNGKILPLKKKYWQEREHISYTINPVFVQIFDNQENTIDFSPNLIHQKLKVQGKNLVFYSVKLNGTEIRQIQKPVLVTGKTKGHIVVAMGLKDLEVVKILKLILIIAYPIIVLFLFFIAQFFAGKSIKPVNTIIETSKKITKNNFSPRIPLPKNKDELYFLAENINQLLQRIENAIAREKQFTSDASHELRTPLAVIKGTLEVLIRKPRTNEEYQEKIDFCIKEVDKINQLLEQLLLLARFEHQKQNIKKEKCYLNAILLDSLSHFSIKIKTKNININTHFSEDFEIFSDQYLVAIIINNLLSNALKYSHENSDIFINIHKNNKQTLLEIKDEGIGIAEEDLQYIFDSFYRSNSMSHETIKGNGLGLSIVKRLCVLLDISIEIQSEINNGFFVQLYFKNE